MRPEVIHRPRVRGVTRADGAAVAAGTRSPGTTSPLKSVIRDILTGVSDEIADPAWNVPVALAELVTPIAELQPWPGNPRRHDLDTIADSLTRHGQYKPIVVQTSTGFVIAGNGTLAAATRLGWTHVAAVQVEVDDDAASRMVAVDNRSHDLGGYDTAELSALLTSLSETGDALAGTGYDLDALDDLLAAVGPPPDLSAYVTPDRSDAAPAEDDAAYAARLTAAESNGPLAARGLAEVLLILSEDDKAVFGATLGAVRAALDGDLGDNPRAGVVALAALNALLLLCRAREAGATVDPAALVADAIAHRAGAAA